MVFKQFLVKNIEFFVWNVMFHKQYVLKIKNLQKRTKPLQITFMLENTRKRMRHQETASIFQNIYFIHIFGTQAIHMCVTFLPVCIIQVVKKDVR